METKLVAAFSAICEEDKVWIPQYLKEVERLQIPFAIHLDKVSDEIKETLTSHPLCVGFTERKEGMFSEKDKQGVLDILDRLGFEWALAWDVDETYERDFPEKLRRLETETKDIVRMRWVNLWEDDKHIRVDGPYQTGRREKIRNLKRFKWVFRNDTVNGPSGVVESGQQMPQYGDWHDTDCLHWGMLTAEIRLQHKERWDKIYGTYTHDGKNPYGFWQYSVDPSITPVIHEYDRA